MRPPTVHIPRPWFGDEDGTPMDVVVTAADLEAGGEIDRMPDEVPADFSSLKSSSPDDVKEPVEQPVKKEEKVEEVKKPDEAKKEEPAKQEEIKKEEKKPFTPPTDEELDKNYTLKPNAPEKLKGDFAKLKDVTKAMRTELEAERAERAKLSEELEKTKLEVGKPPADIEEKLKRLDEVEKMLELDTDPELKSHLASALEKTDTDLLSFLVENGLPQETADEIEGAGVDKWDGWAGLLDHIKGNVFLKQEIEDKLRGRAVTAREHSANVTRLKSDKEAITTIRTEREKAQATKFSTEFQRHAVEKMESTHVWAKLKEIPADATPEQKKEIEEHNAVIAEASAAIKDSLTKVYHRDPAETANVVLNAMRAAVLEKENAKSAGRITAAKAETEKANKRVAELEDTIAKLKGAGRKIESQSAPAGATKATTVAGRNEQGYDLPDFSQIGSKD